ncbi:heme ABC transporter ATP-binding protein [Serratia sp. DD3]|uniref:heme ABC transporter ATP-binding protein n=1 Tax=Serratia sp. DD3 TaxID=1410619 RepID=UPI0003C51594|nr:heme ABC transporter ATP-binding protein [Serratia sp. DD3]KEY59137.1 hemin import ATP-binding protein HmuV [Serratia sp. DD3]
MTTALSVRNLSLRRGNRPILQEINLTLQAGTLSAILGSNGAGKSSLFNSIGGELPYEGDIEILGQPRQHWQRAALAKRLAILPQSSSLNFDFLCHEVVQLGRLPHRSGQQADRRIADHCLAQVGATHLADRPYPALSGGEKQRVHLARVLAQLQDDTATGQPNLLLLDEPTSALDLKYQHQILQQVSNYARQGHAVLVILHDLNLAARYADRLILLHQGRCYAEGSPEQVLTPAAVKTVFGIEVSLMRHPQSGVIQVF